MCVCVIEADSSTPSLDTILSNPHNLSIFTLSSHLFLRFPSARTSVHRHYHKIAATSEATIVEMNVVLQMGTLLIDKIVHSMYITHAYIVTYRPTVGQRLDKHIPAETDSW
jgi:hypothetical protein